MINVPNLLSILRLVLVGPLLYLAWHGEPAWFLATLAVSLFSDLADGYLARRLDQASELGTKLDSWGDFATYMTVPICAWWLWPDLLRREAPFAVAVVVSYVVPVGVGFLKYGRLTSYHTWGAKLSSVLIGPTAFVLFLDGPALPFRIATVVLVLSQIEEIAMTAMLPAWHANVPTLRHALALARREE